MKTDLKNPSYLYITCIKYVYICILGIIKPRLCAVSSSAISEADGEF